MTELDGEVSLEPSVDKETGTVDIVKLEAEVLDAGP